MDNVCDVGGVTDGNATVHYCDLWNVWSYQSNRFPGIGWRLGVRKQEIVFYCAGGHPTLQTHVCTHTYVQRHAHKPVQHSHTVQLLSLSISHCFYCDLTVLIQFHSSSALFFRKQALINPLFATCPAPYSKQS